MKKPIILLMIIFGLASCGDDGPNQNIDFDKTDLLINISDGFAFPALTNFQSTATDLSTKIAGFVNDPTQVNLEAARVAFTSTYLSWQNVNIFEFGPAETSALRSNINTFPTDISNINALVVAGTYNLDALSNYDSKGLPALDYLLYGKDAQDEDIIALFKTDALKENYKQFIQDIVADITVKINATVSSWTAGYQNTFKESKANNIGSSISVFLNAYIQHFENRFRTLKIGLPVGIFSIEGMSFPEECEAFYGRNSVALIKENFRQLEAIYFGNSTNNINDVGLEEYLIEVDAANINIAIKDQLTTIKAQLNKLSDPLSEQVVEDRATVIEVYTTVQQLIPLLKADMASALSIQITFADTDGD